MSEEPIKWDEYRIPLDPLPRGPGHEVPEQNPPGDRESSGGPGRGELGLHGAAFTAGRRVLSLIFWWVGGVAFVLGCAVGLASLYESVLYERLWGGMPDDASEASAWSSRRLAMTKFAAVLGAVLGGAIVRLGHMIWNKKE